MALFSLLSPHKPEAQAKDSPPLRLRFRLVFRNNLDPVISARMLTFGGQIFFRPRTFSNPAKIPPRYLPEIITSPASPSLVFSQV
jgi:hypothetical protein